MKKAVAYCRYSTDLQKEVSIEDQIALCEQIAARHNFKVVEVFSDRAKSGASMFERDGLLALMQASKLRKFDAVVTESLSRLSRDQEDTAAIYKRLKFAEIKIFDANGEVSDVHVGVGMPSRVRPRAMWRGGLPEAYSSKILRTILASSGSISRSPGLPGTRRYP